MDRLPNARTLLLSLAALVVVAGVAAAGWYASRPAKPPNVLIILWDTTRADRLSLYRYDLETTPRMAKWAEENGVVFENAISPDMWTVPSHASLFTGLPPGTHGAGFDHRWLDAKNVTLAEWFGQHGWDTYAFSANPNLSPKRINLLQGFATIDTSWSKQWKDAVVANTRAKLIHRDKSTEISPSFPGRQHTLGFYNAAPIAHQAFVKWLDERPDQDKPFFVYLSYMEAHKPRVPTLDSRRKLTDDDTVRLGLDTDLSFKNQLLYSYGKLSYTPEELTAVNRVYDAALADLDNATADLLDDLKTRGVLDDTIVVFTADHGEQLGEHQLFGHRSGIYQALLHVPLVIAYPAKLAPKHVQSPTTNLQIYDTLLQLAGLPSPGTGHVTGNLATLEEGIRAIFSETLSIDREGFSKVKQLYPDLGRDVWANTYRSVVLGHHKLIETVSFDTHELVTCQLYDLDADPGENTNLFEDPANNDVSADLLKKIEDWQASEVKWDPSQADKVEENLGAAEKKQLELLGYLTPEICDNKVDDDDDGLIDCADDSCAQATECGGHPQVIPLAPGNRCKLPG
jgi:arylsulfatase A-like enzyme